MDDQPPEQKDGRCTANRRAWQAKQAVESPQQYCWNNVFTREEREACFLFAHRGRGPDFFKAFVVTHRSTFAVKLSTCAFLPTLARYFGLYLEQKKPLRHDELLTNPDDWTVWNANLFMAEYDTVLSIVDMNKKGVTPSTQLMLRIFQELLPAESKGYRFHALFSSLLHDLETRKEWQQCMTRRWGLLYKCLSVRGKDTDEETRNKVVPCEPHSCQLIS